ncbi:DinB family protein [Halobacillus sp. Nhm2S1]|uniref:DinB family protein n=1 Tax=Halobacillus sp. Nhm2S1 TaxID=2866716 RepID=UPI001C733CAD|nr:DinB family protein [Halobacillus sp. Nhm2S1]MBX0356134.1 DinB family protein [Halobacillus sp. Nhm2S1]
MISYQVQSEKGFSEKIGELVCMLEHARAVTIQEVADLTQDELDECETGGNSIGMLLSHMAAIEFVHQIISFDERDLTPEEQDEWGAALELGDKARAKFRDIPVDDYLDLLETTRDTTLEYLKEKDDDWLFEERSWPNGVKYNPYYLWFHVMEDEISHRGQIRAMIRSKKQRKISSF